MSDVIAEIGVDHTVIVTEDGVVAVDLVLSLGGHVFAATGSARVDPNDDFDSQIGQEIAYGRAIRLLGRRILASGQDAVHELDRKKQKQKAASKAAHKAKRKASKQVRKSLGY